MPSASMKTVDMSCRRAQKALECDICLTVQCRSHIPDGHMFAPLLRTTWSVRRSWSRAMAACMAAIR
eukprot:scaffold21216_cov31-Prasinocladus_malaysianus.AAC.1